MAVLKVNFKHHGNSAERIARGEFAIEDAATRRDIDLNTNWELCFPPGQRVEMSILVSASLEYGNSIEIEQTRCRLIPDPADSFPLKLKLETCERNEVVIYQNVRLRCDG